MLARLPEFIDPIQLADKRGSLKGQIALQKLDRLSDLLFDDAGVVTIEFFFQREGRLATIDGHLETVLQLRCQSCLEALTWPVSSDIKLGIVTTVEQADKLPEEFEPLLLESETIPLKAIVEDELLLVLPAFPKHQHVCFDAGRFINTPINKTVSPDDDKSLSRENPFSILANLKNTGDS